jgi:hypothetical protein
LRFSAWNFSAYAEIITRFKPAALLRRFLFSMAVMIASALDWGLFELDSNLFSFV